MKYLIFALIFSIINLNNVYILSYKVNCVRILSVLLVFIALARYMPIRSLSRYTRSVVKWAFILVSFKLFLYLTLHFDNDLEPLFTYFKELFVILLLPAFEYVGFKSIEKTILICAIPAILLGLVQIVDPTVSLDTLLPANPLVFTERITEHYLQAERRISGTFNIAIGYALLLGMLCMVVGAQFMRPNKILKPFWGIVFLGLHSMVIFTQTRSAIYGIIPAVILAYLLSGERMLKRAFVTSIITVVCIVLFGSFTALVMQYSNRSALKMDANTYYKITANVYGVYGALADNPFFGIRKSASLHDSREKYMRDQKRDLELLKKARKDLGGDFLDSGEFNHPLIQTHHNLYAYYLRYYGLIGFGFFSMMVLVIFRKVICKKEIRHRFVLLSVFFFILQYALLHNTTILGTPLFWVLLANGEENA
jgi:hypothetical protein